MDDMLFFLVGFILITAAILYIIRKIRMKLVTRFEQFKEAIGIENIIEATMSATVYDHPGKSPNTKLSGTCFVAITDEEVFYELFFPKKVWRAGYENIMGVSVLSAPGESYLWLAYVDDEGRKIQAKIKLDNPALWKRRIIEQIQKYCERENIEPMLVDTEDKEINYRLSMSTSEFHMMTDL